MLIISLIVIAIIIGAIVGLFKYRKETFFKDLPVNPLKKNGRIVSLNPNDIVIKSREYWEDQDVELSGTAMLDAMYGREELNSKQRKVISALLYEGEYNGKTVKYHSSPIYQDELTIRAALSNIKEVKVYVDPNDESNYYFDISSLVAY